MPKKTKSSRQSLPRIWCDFNSSGWSGEDDDECYYNFDHIALAACRPREGKRVFIYEKGREGMIMGCEATIEPYEHIITHERRWRLRPIHGTGLLGDV
jgi:hypothetical protein